MKSDGAFGLLWTNATIRPKVGDRSIELKTSSKSWRSVASKYASPGEMSGPRSCDDRYEHHCHPD